MNKIAIAVHGGASDLKPYLKKHIPENEAGLSEALEAAYKVLKKGGSALNAVETAVKILEDNPFFNAGRGSCLNSKGEIEMDAAIMDGRTLKAGAVSMVRKVRNPIQLARTVMTETRHVFLSGYGALELAHFQGIGLEPDAYFITEHQVDEWLEKSKHFKVEKMLKRRLRGTVGAVALDKKGNMAAGTSTGGTSNSLPGRIGDSCVIGAGCYANNQTCAVSGTGDGEFLITGVIAHSISMMMELQNMPIQEACDYVIKTRNKKIKGQIGVIALNPQGEIGNCFNSPIMRRGWIDGNGNRFVKILK
jgi:beta-aspartyl-peptidase (threonine type)